MTKKTYMKPSLKEVKIQQQHVICTSPGMNTQLQQTTVESAWSRGGDFNDVEE